jgi:SAM-dependent methyltransferase
VSRETTYDRVLYRGLPFGQTHPDRLATLATLFGMSPAPVDRCRFLEIGCGDGGNLIPMAFMLPNSTFAGFDLAETPIAMARRAAETLGLSNLRLFQADIMEIGPDLGEFDYIVAHGVYSWVPDFVRERLMAMARDHLAPQGVAYISYNALPGCHIRQMIRDMMLFHLRDVHDSQARIEGALGFLKMLLDGPDSKESSTTALVKDEVKALFERDPSVLFHDELGEVYFPLHFHDFIAHAARHGLQYLAEANFPDMETRRYSDDLRDHMERYSGGRRMEREQYMDFLKCRKFRQTLLCHAGLEVPPDAIQDRVRNMYAASPASSVSSNPSVRGEQAEEFRGQKGAAMKTAHPLAKSAITHLIRMWPEAVHFEELAARCGEMTGSGADPEALAEILMTMYRAGLAELHVHQPGCVSKPGECPASSSLARWQVRQGQTVTTMRHTTVEATGDIEKRLLELLDGTRDRAALAAEIGPMIRPSLSHTALMAELDKNLDKLARFGLLVA